MRVAARDMQAGSTAPTAMRRELRYGLAIALVAAALLLSLLLRVPFGNPFWFFFPVAVIGGTWFGGRGPGWVAVGLSTVAVLYYFIPPVDSFAVKPQDVPFFLTFVACEAVANWLFSWRKEVEDSLRSSRDELEIRVAERTAELRNANDALLNQIAEQRRTEEALQRTRTELARVVRITTLGELTASIAHEVNQPLAAVVANADACVAWLGLENPDLIEARAAAERAIQGATRASAVIARIRSLINKAAPERAIVQVNGVIDETMALAEGQASRNQISIALELEPGLPAALGDKIQLQQVILNLLMNAIESMSAITGRPRQVTIRSRILQSEQICVSVQDSGVGVSEEIMPRLFEPFFTTRSQGVGMGLAISRSIIEAHGGRLWAESTVGQGAVFQFTLPALGGP
jgi:C4-dicarboxylate-specific signal transduction histidine kinase